MIARKNYAGNPFYTSMKKTDLTCSVQNDRVRELREFTSGSQRHLGELAVAATSSTI